MHELLSLEMPWMQQYFSEEEPTCCLCDLGGAWSCPSEKNLYLQMQIQILGDKMLIVHVKSGADVDKVIVL